MMLTHIFLSRTSPMAPSKSTPRTASQSYSRQALIWLIVTLLLGVVTALLWMLSQTPAMGAKIENEPVSAPKMLADEFEQPLKVESLHELDTDVQPISFDATVRDLRNYPDEFKDKRYLLANKGKWTVQVMNVAENEVVVSYLEGRKDRDKFAYFRYLDEENQVRYMLTYGIMSSPQEAVGAAKLIDFKLPANVRVLPEEINRYVSIIDNYERPDPVKDLSTKRTRAVDLKPTKREIPVRQKTQEVNNTTSEQSDSSVSDRSSQNVASNSSTEESIRQSVDTSATLSVTEERIVGNESQSAPEASAKKEGNTNKPKPDNNKSVSVETENSSIVKKTPVAPTPKPSNTNNGNTTSNNNASSTTKSSNANSAKNGGDSIKTLIEDKSN